MILIIVAIILLCAITMALQSIYNDLSKLIRGGFSWKKLLGSSPRYLFLTVVALTFLFPIYFMGNVSLQDMRGIHEIRLIPQEIFPWYWAGITNSRNWTSAITNSLIICTSSVLLSIVVCFPAAYAFSRSKFRADKHIFFWMFFYRMAPPICFILALLAMYRGMGLWDTQFGVILSYCIFNVPLGTWLMTSFMSGIPKEIDESAFIDGHSLLSFFRKIFIPLSKPGIAVTGFFVWMFSWTEWFMASILTSRFAKPLTAQMLTLWGGGSGLSAAAGVITMIPGLFLILWARTYLARGFTFGKV